MQTAGSGLIWIGIAYWVLVLVMVGAVTIMLVSVARRGDERGNHIRTQAMAYAFVAVVGFALLDVIWTMIRMISGQSGSVYPFAYLFITALAFVIALAVTRRRYGD